MRVDIWDVGQTAVAPSLGFPRGMEEKYELGEQLGQGGFGMVCVAKNKQTGEEVACKAIGKTLPDTNDGVQNRRHQDNIRREVAVLGALKGVLNVAGLKDVFEDDNCVYLLLEYCKGGELFHVVGERKYTETTVARFMQAVLLTLVQCHENGILHRDVKPGNFMLRDSSEDSPLKAIDFGMAVFFDASKLPRTDLGLDGTPWFMAPETLQSDVYPKSDVWAAGVMAFQLLTGRLPFDDHRNPRKPAISQIWKSILTERLNFERSFWKGISTEAKDFVQQLLERDVAKRPTAKEALKHCWFKATLEGAGAEAAAAGGADAPVPLHSDVVQRLQRFGQSSLFKRSVLQMIAQEIIPLIQSSRHGAAVFGGRSLSCASLASAGSEPGGSSHGPVPKQVQGMEGPLLGPHHHQGPCSVCGKVSNLEQTVAGLSGRGLSHYQRATSGSLRGGFFLPTSASTGSFGSLHGAAAVHHQPALAAGGSGRGLGQFQRAGSGSLRGGTGYLVCGGPLPPSGTGAGGGFDSLHSHRGDAAQVQLFPAAQHQHQAPAASGGPVGNCRSSQATPQGMMPWPNNVPGGLLRPRLRPLEAHSGPFGHLASGGSNLSALQLQERQHAPAAGAVVPAPHGSLRRVRSHQGGLLPMTMADHYPSASRSTVHGGAAALSSLGSSRAHRHAMKRINSMVFERQLRSSGPSFDHLPALVGEGWPVGPEASLFPPSGGTLRTSTSRDDLDMMPSGSGLHVVGMKRNLSEDVFRGVCKACREAVECGVAPPNGSDSGSSKPPLKRNYSDPELPAIKVSDTDVLQQLLRRLEFHEESMPVGDLADKLMEMGFQVSKQEAIHLLQQMGLGDDNDQEVTKAQFLASQIDWKILEAKYTDIFLDKAQKVFDRIDEDQSGTVSGAEIARVLREKLPDKDVEEAVQHAFWEAGLLKDMSQSYETAELTVGDFMGALGRWHGLDLFEGRNRHVNLFSASVPEDEEGDAEAAAGGATQERAVRGGQMALKAMLSEIRE